MLNVPSNQFFRRGLWVGLTLAAFAGHAAADTQVVYVYDFEFSIFRPDRGPVTDAVINPGDTVFWVWLNDFHNVVSLIGSLEEFESPVFEAGDSFEHRFTQPGVYTYYCQPHGIDNGDGTAQGMVGTVTVLPAPAVITLFMALAALRRRRTR